MEPLDENLSAKLAKMAKPFSYGSMKKRPVPMARPLKKVTRMYPRGSKEDRLQDSVARIRKGTIFTRMKSDKADYTLTIRILEAIEEACMCPIDELRNNKRDSGLTTARVIYVFLERMLNKRSYPEVGAIINKHHTSCIHMRRNFNNHKGTKIFQVYMRNDKLRKLYESAIKGDFKWESERHSQ